MSLFGVNWLGIDFDTDGVFYNKFFKRKLEERSYLTVEFPTSNDRVFRSYIPFLENPTISEQSSSRLQEYKLVGRAGSLFGYMGADSRKIDVTFRINLLHLMHLQATEGLATRFLSSFKLFFSDREKAKERFELKKSFNEQEEETDTGYNDPFAEEQTPIPFEDVDASRGIGRAPTDLGERKEIDHAAIHRKYYQEAVGELIGEGGFLNGITGIFGKISDFFEPEDAVNLDKIINTVYVWLNLIRGTTLNNSRNTLYGPPTVRLTHGPMYNNIPCVVDSYNIAIVNDGGYDSQTMTPKIIEVKLSLKENRTGNFGAFNAGVIEEGDNLAGWEAIYSTNNLDPYNGLINPLDVSSISYIQE